MGADELVLCLDRSGLPPMWRRDDLALPLTEEDLEYFERCGYRFAPRREIECDFTVKQVIPYAVVSDSADRMLVYRRRGAETRLHDLWSLGIGGHVNDADCVPSGFRETLFSGLRRECYEELGTEVNDFSLIGIINEERTDVGRAHIGIVFRIRLPHKPPASDELKDWRFAGHDRLSSYDFELWSLLALRLIRSGGSETAARPC